MLFGFLKTCFNKRMLQKIGMVWRFIKFYLSADTIYRVHSPFVFNLLEEIMDREKRYYVFDAIEGIRKDLLRSKEKVEVLDLGAGSHRDNAKERALRNIAKSALTSPYYCQLLFRLIKFSEPKQIIELGTSLGISALYFAKAAPASKVITLEGSPNIANKAKENFRSLEVENIEVINGNFDQTFYPLLASLDKVDLVFIDGNHREKPTIEYFEACLAKASENTILVFDDIYWSSGMAKAWQSIQNHSEVKLTIDFFFLGLVFFKKDQKEEQHLKIVPKKWKPFQSGFFR